MTGIRRKGRIAALQVLYEVDSTNHEPEEILARLTGEEKSPSLVVDFALELIRGVLDNKDKLDGTIQKFAPVFPVEQLANIDRNILRIAIFEVILNNKTPIKAAINEAVELAKIFGSDASPKFINGVLGSVVTVLAGQKKKPEKKE